MSITLCQDEAAWDSAVHEMNGALYQSWGWGELFRLAGRRPWRVLAEDSDGHRAAAQIFEINLTPGFRLMWAPFGFVATSPHSHAMKELMVWLCSFLKQRKAPCLRIDPPVMDADESRKRLLEELGFRHLPDPWLAWGAFPRNAMVVGLRPGEQELLRKMRQKHRQHINAAGRYGLRIELGTSVEHVAHVHRMVEAAGERRSFTPRSLEWLATVRERFLVNDGGVIGLAWHGDIVVAAILCAVFGDRCYALFAGFLPECAHLHPMEPLYWSTMKWAKQMGCVEYDMQNAPVTNPPTQNQPGYGLYHFKAGFGAEFRYFVGAFDLVGSEIRYFIIRLIETRSGHFVYRTVDEARWLRYRMRGLASDFRTMLRRVAKGAEAL